jgi:hypothetical protein
MNNEILFVVLSWHLMLPAYLFWLSLPVSQIHQKGEGRWISVLYSRLPVAYRYLAMSLHDRHNISAVLCHLWDMDLSALFLNDFFVRLYTFFLLFLPVANAPVLCDEIVNPLRGIRWKSVREHGRQHDNWFHEKFYRICLDVCLGYDRIYSLSFERFPYPLVWCINPEVRKCAWYDDRNVKYAKKVMKILLFVFLYWIFKWLFYGLESPLV